MAEDDMFSPHLSDFPYRSPEATAFLRYGQYEVAQYTGNPDIRIPLYTLSYRDIQLPLELTYQGGGIRVDEEASWVGLGWNLSVGGCINYIPAGALDYHARTGSDEAYQGFFNQNTATIFQVSELPFQSEEDYTHVPRSIRSDLLNGLGERDFFAVSLPGKSFLFFVNPLTNQPEIIGRNDAVYSIIKDEYGNGNLNCGWTIVDDNGTSYHFITKEYTDNNQGQIYTAAWYLDQIISQTGNSVLFHYENSGSLRYLPKIYQQYDYVISRNDELNTMGGDLTGLPYVPSVTYSSPGYFSQYMNSTNVMHKGFLSSIETSDQIITFELESREDIEGDAKRLKYFTVRSRADNSVVKKITFNYSYFNSSTIGGDYLETFTGVTAYRSKRLKLLSIDDGIGDEILTHNFEYDESQALPYKTSHSKDFWGYYNGKENNLLTSRGELTTGHSFVPTPKDCFWGDNELNELPAGLRSLVGANRFSSSRYIKAGILTKITYPTKGYTIFSYEPHEFYASYWYPDNGISPYWKSFYAVHDNVSQHHTHEEFTLDATYEGILEAVLSWGDANDIRPLYQECLGYVNIYKTDGSGFSPVIVQLRGQSNLYYLNNDSYQEKLNVILPAGNYVMVANLQSIVSSGSNVCVSGRLNIDKSAISDASTGAGLRIKDISNFESDGTLLEKESFSYLKEDGTSSGVLLVPVGAAQQFNQLETVRLAGGDQYSSSLFSIRRFSNGGGGTPTFTVMLAGGNVGYSRVIENKINSENDTTRIVSYYENNKAELRLSNVALFEASFNNGALCRRVYLDNSYDTIKTVLNTYSMTNATELKCNIMFENGMSSAPVSDSWMSVCASHGCYKYICKVFPYMRIWKPLQKTIVTEYQNGIPAMRTEHTYDYNPLNHLQFRDSFVNSDGSQYETEFLYPSDYPDDNMCQELVNRHILRPVVHQKVYKDESIIKQKKVLYSFQQVNGQYLFSPCIEQFALMDQPLEDRISYAYDDVCNITSMVQDSVIKQTWLWGYGKMYPVAKIEGADYSQVKEWLGISTINALASNYTSIPSALASIRAILSQHPVSVTTYTYKPLVGIESVTQPNGTVAMYEYDSFGRLKKVYDTNGDLIKQYDYNYAQ